MNLKFKPPYCIVGYGKSGKATAQFLRASGISDADIFIFDDKLKDYINLNPIDFIKSSNIQTLVVTPGYPLKTPWLITLAKEGITLINEITLAAQILTDEKLIGVTGSVGKSTVVALLEVGIKSQNQQYFVGGNFGTPFCEYAYQIITGARSRAKWIILELSSYHLEILEDIFFDWSALTFLTANHLERYTSKSEYYSTKWKLINLTKNKMIINSEGGDNYSFAQDHLNSKILYCNKKDLDLSPYQLNNSYLLGEHNQDNIALATKVALVCGWDNSSIESMKRYGGLPHRMENLGEAKGIQFINDSKATTMDSVQIAVKATLKQLKSETSSLHLLLGGLDKNLPWENLASLHTLPNVKFYFFGHCAQLAKSKSNLPGETFLNLKSAFSNLILSIKLGDTVLLSPGGTSLDEFSNFEQRGDYFKSLVQIFSQG